MIGADARASSGQTDEHDGPIFGHIHSKDVEADTPKVMPEVLRAEGYDGVTSYESVYHPGNRGFETGFPQNTGRIKSVFG